MNFCYLHQIKHEEGMNIKRHLKKCKHPHAYNTYIHTRVQTPTQTPTENMPTFCENLDHYISHVHFTASIRLPYFIYSARSYSKLFHFLK